MHFPIVICKRTFVVDGDSDVPWRAVLAFLEDGETAPDFLLGAYLFEGCDFWTVDCAEKRRVVG